MKKLGTESGFTKAEMAVLVALVLVAVGAAIGGLTQNPAMWQTTTVVRTAPPTTVVTTAPPTSIVTTVYITVTTVKPTTVTTTPPLTTTVSITTITTTTYTTLEGPTSVTLSIELQPGACLKIKGSIGNELHVRYKAGASISYSVTLARLVVARGRCEEGKVSLSVEASVEYEVSLENPIGEGRPNTAIDVSYSIGVDMELEEDP